MAKKTTSIGPWIVVATVIIGFFCIFGCVLSLIAIKGRD